MTRHLVDANDLVGFEKESHPLQEYLVLHTTCSTVCRVVNLSLCGISIWGENAQHNTKYSSRRSRIRRQSLQNENTLNKNKTSARHCTTFSHGSRNNIWDVRLDVETATSQKLDQIILTEFSASHYSHCGLDCSKSANWFAVSTEPNLTSWRRQE